MGERGRGEVKDKRVGVELTRKNLSMRQLVEGQVGLLYHFNTSNSSVSKWGTDTCHLIFKFCQLLSQSNMPTSIKVFLLVAFNPLIVVMI